MSATQWQQRFWSCDVFRQTVSALPVAVCARTSQKESLPLQEDWSREARDPHCTLSCMQNCMERALGKLEMTI